LSHLRKKSDTEIGIHHLDQGQQAARCESLHFLRVANLASGKRVVAQAVAVVEQQNAVGVEPAESIVFGIDSLCSAAARKPERVLKQRNDIDATQFSGQREQ